jgi:hypothetical protein
LTFVFLLALWICHLFNPTSFSPIFIISYGVRIDVNPWLSLSIAWSMMLMLARVVTLLIVKCGVGSDGEECDVTITQKRHMMERSLTEFGFNLLSIRFQFAVNSISICYQIRFSM